MKEGKDFKEKIMCQRKLFTESLHSKKVKLGTGKVLKNGKMKGYEYVWLSILCQHFFQ
jgi:hypothetical protein